MFGALAPVRVVAYDATPSLLLIDVNVVKVFCSVSESRGGVRGFCQNQFFVMALEAEGILLLSKGGVKVDGKGCLSIRQLLEPWGL